LTLKDESNMVIRYTWKHSAVHRRTPEGSLSKTAVRTSDLEHDAVPYFMWAPDTAVRKADNLITILGHCHAIWEPELPETLWAPRACNGTDLPVYQTQPRHVTY